MVREKRPSVGAMAQSNGITVLPLAGNCFSSATESSVQPAEWQNGSTHGAIPLAEAALPIAASTGAHVSSRPHVSLSFIYKEVVQ